MVLNPLIHRIKRDPKVDPRAGDVLRAAGAGPLGNPIIITVEKVDSEVVLFRTVWAVHEMNITDWREWWDE